MSSSFLIKWKTMGAATTKETKKKRKDGERRKLAKDRVQPIWRFAVDALFYLVDVFVMFTVVACNFSRVDLQERRSFVRNSSFEIYLSTVSWRSYCGIERYCKARRWELRAPTSNVCNNKSTIAIINTNWDHRAKVQGAEMKTTTARRVPQSSTLLISFVFRLRRTSNTSSLPAAFRFFEATIKTRREIANIQ